MDWIFEDQVFVPPNPNPYEGFVYIIENIVNGKKYIGKKHFWSRQKNRKLGRKQTKESDWRDYYGSSEDLAKDIEVFGKENFTRTILHLCIFKKQMTYYEEYEQWERNVLIKDDYYNTNIGGKFFVRERRIYQATTKEITTKNEKWRQIRSENMKGDGNVSKRPDVKAKLSAAKKGPKHHQYGKPLDDEHKEKLINSLSKTVTYEGKSWPSISEFRRETGFSYKNYKLGVLNGSIIEGENPKIKPFTEEHRANMRKSKSKT